MPYSFRRFNFKGLENSVIVLIDMTELCSEKNRSLLYVGMSRARHRLFVLVAQSAKTDYLLAVQNRISKLKVKR
jgi:superfamily I DNA/RNA helicase